MKRAQALDAAGMAIIMAMSLSWGFQQVTTKWALLQVDPAAQAAIRSAVGALVVALYMLWRGQKFDFRDGTLKAGLVVGFLFALEFLFLFTGLARTSASRGVVFLFTAPFVVALGSRFILRQDVLDRRGWIGIVIAFLGVAVAMQPWSTPASLAGDVLTLAAGIAWGATTIYIRGSALRDASFAKTLLYQAGISAPLLGLAALAMGEGIAWPWTGLTWFSMAYHSIWVVGISYTIWFALLQRYSPSRLSAFTFVTPLSGIACGHLFLGDPLPADFLIAVTLLIAGLLLVTWPAKKSV